MQQKLIDPAYLLTRINAAPKPLRGRLIPIYWSVIAAHATPST